MLIMSSCSQWSLFHKSLQPSVLCSKLCYNWKYNDKVHKNHINLFIAGTLLIGYFTVLYSQFFTFSCV